PGVLLSGQQGIKGAAQHCEAAVADPLHFIHSVHTTGVEIHQPAALGLLGLRKRIWQRRTRVADRRGKALPAVEMPQGRIAESIKEIQGYGPQSADAEFPFTVRSYSSAGEGMGEDH